MKKINLLLLLLVTLLLSGCSLLLEIADPSSSESDSDSNPPQIQVNEGDIDFIIEMVNFKFKPNEITASPGETIKIKLSSTAGTHDFVIDELKIQSDTLSKWEEEILEFKVPINAAGKEYEFYSSQGIQKRLGMTGTLTVRRF